MATSAHSTTAAPTYADLVDRSGRINRKVVFKLAHARVQSDKVRLGDEALPYPAALGWYLTEIAAWAQLARETRFYARVAS